MKAKTKIIVVKANTTTMLDAKLAAVAILYGRHEITVGKIGWEKGVWITSVVIVFNQ